jgi:MFS family permease
VRGHSAPELPNWALALASAVILVETSLFAILSPLLPYYQDLFDVSGAETGVLTGMYSAGNVIGAFPAVLVVRRFGTRRVTICALAVLAVSTVGFALAQSYTALLGFRFLQGLGGIVAWIAASAWVVHMAPAEARGRAVSITLGAGFLGATAGPAMAWVATETSPRAVFLVAAVVTGALMFAAAAAIHSTSVSRRVLRPAGRRTANGPAGVAMLMNAFLMGVPLAVIPLWLDHQGSPTSVIAAMFLVASMGRAVGTPCVGAMTDRVGDRRPMVVIAIALLATFALTGVDSAIWIIVAGSVVIWALLGMHMSVAATVLARASNDQVSLWAAISFLWASGMLIGSLAFAALYDEVGFGAVACVAAGGSAALVLLAAKGPVTARHATAPEPSGA